MWIQFGLDVFQSDVVQFPFDDFVIVLQNFVLGLGRSVFSVKKKRKNQQKKDGENPSEQKIIWK